jgi:V/A-type H+-transporting ATPase subunit E
VVGKEDEMPGLESIIQKIKEDADSVLLQLEAQTKAQTDQIIEDARLELETKRKEMQKNAQAAGLLKQERMISMAKLEGSKTLLKTKRDLMEQVFDKTVRLLTGMKDSEYEKLLIRMIVNADPVESGSVRLNERDKKRISTFFIHSVNKEFKKKGKNVSFTLDPVPGNFSGGFVLICGNVEINGTFEKIVEMRRSELERIVSETLFSD